MISRASDEITRLLPFSHMIDGCLTGADWPWRLNWLGHRTKQDPACARMQRRPTITEWNHRHLLQGPYQCRMVALKPEVAPSIAETGLQVTLPLQLHSPMQFATMMTVTMYRLRCWS